MKFLPPDTRRDVEERGPELALYVTYSHPTKIAISSLLRPIHAGRSLSTVDLALPGDNSGENISDKNGSYCELTTHFWAWKNDNVSDVIGFFHYRRFLDLSGAKRKNVTDAIPVGSVDGRFVKKYGLTKKSCRLPLGEFDLISPLPVDVRIYGAVSVLKQYEQSPNHFLADLLRTGDIIHELYPHDLVHFNAVIEGRLLIQHNVYVMKRDIFETYSKWLFTILGELERRTNISGYTLAGRRVFGYVAERLFTVFVRKLRMEGRRVVFTNMIFIDGLSPWRRANAKILARWQRVSKAVGLKK